MQTIQDSHEKLLYLMDKVLAAIDFTEDSMAMADEISQMEDAIRDSVKQGWKFKRK